ncbi:MAG: hypothetical protein ISS57_13810 [Anaerolineales bacterium]|nr:hypothetical protein [Anaerolineales bacterium]
MAIGELIASFFTSAGPGGAVVIVVIVLAAAVYTRLTRWILQGSEGEGTARYRPFR